MKNYLLVFFSIASFSLCSAEMILGKEKISPGIDLIFEAAPKDTIHPQQFFRAESDTDIHIEMLANWSESSPEGSPVNGFVAYLKVYATIKSESGKEETVMLTPHLNISDNLHYAQNIKLPASIDELYEVTFTINPPEKSDLGIHYDWNEEIGYLVTKNTFSYKGLNFKEIALSSRR